LRFVRILKTEIDRILFATRSAPARLQRENIVLLKEKLDLNEYQVRAALVRNPRRQNRIEGRQNKE
jgi:hypothetical protein